MSTEPEEKPPGGCSFFLKAISLPAFSFTMGFMGIDRVLAGDWKVGGLQMFIFFFAAQTLSSHEPQHPLSVLCLLAIFIGWASNLVYTTRNYKRKWGEPEEQPSATVAFWTAVCLGLFGVDRYYLGDNILGAIKTSLIVVAGIQNQAAGIGPDADVTANPLMVVSIAWWFCDVMISPLRARCL